MTAADRYNPERFRIPFSAEVAKSVDAVDSKSTVEIRAGSSPAFGTINTSLTFPEVYKSRKIFKTSKLPYFMVFVGLLWSTPFGGIIGACQFDQDLCPKMKLNARQIETAKPKEKAYKMADGGGLYLEVSLKVPNTGA